MGLLIEFGVFYLIIYLVVCAIGKRFPSLGNAIIKYKYWLSFALLAYGVHNAMHWQGKSLPMGTFVIAVMMLFLPKRKRFTTPTR